MTTATACRARGRHHSRTTHRARGTRRNSSLARTRPLVVVALVIAAARGAVAFAGARQMAFPSELQPAPRLCVRWSTNGDGDGDSDGDFRRVDASERLSDAAAPLDVPSRTAVVAARSPSWNAPSRLALVVFPLLLLLSATARPSEAIAAYSGLLAEYPLVTKSLTSGILCGASDAIAQFRDSTRKGFNYGRWIRFAGELLLLSRFWYGVNYSLVVYKSIDLERGLIRTLVDRHSFLGDVRQIHHFFQPVNELEVFLFSILTKPI